MSSPATRAEQIAAFYANTARSIQAIVRHRVNAPIATIEDACQNAWEILTRRPDITLDERGTRWLITVAIHGAWKLNAGRDIPMGAMRPGGDRDALELPEPVDTAPGPEERAIARTEHEERCADFRALKPAERHSLYLQGLGHSYNEIAEQTSSSYTAVNRRLTEGRARLRRLEAQRTPDNDDAT